VCINIVNINILLSQLFLIIDVAVSSNIPPNQGGKYGGFGYQMDPPPKSSSQELFDTAISSIATVKYLLFNKFQF